MQYELHNTDCLSWLENQPTGHFDAIISDPPYMTTNLHFDKAPSIDWAAWWAQAWRVVKPSGVVVLFAADLFTVDLILTQRANYRYRLVWEKTSGQGFLRANLMPLKAHEDILIFGKVAKGATYNPQKSAGAAWSHPGRASKEQYSGNTESMASTSEGARHPKTVIKFANSNFESLHPTQKPLDLMRWLVRTYTNPADKVLDCFAGSGSTLAACLMEGRNAVGCELDAGYYAKATARLQSIVNTPQLTF